MLNREYNQHLQLQHVLLIQTTLTSHCIPQEATKEIANLKSCLIWQNMLRYTRNYQRQKDISNLLRNKESIHKAKLTLKQQTLRLLWLNSFLKRLITTIYLDSRHKVLTKLQNQIMNKTRRLCKITKILKMETQIVVAVVSLLLIDQVLISQG